jgi:hypothetical protein
MDARCPDDMEPHVWFFLRTVQQAQMDAQMKIPERRRATARQKRWDQLRLEIKQDAIDYITNPGRLERDLRLFGFETNINMRFAHAHLLHSKPVR